MKRKSIYNTCLFLAVILFSSFVLTRPSDKPTLFLIGDSTVKNGQGKGDGNQWGWGSFINEYFDTTRIHVENHALGGTSSRTFRTRGLWTKVLDKIKPGDFVIMQFGHNDGSPLDDTARARGTIKSTGDEIREIYNPITRQQEVVHTYGWYMSRFIAEAREKGAIPIVCSPVPRSNWMEGKVKRGGEGYSKLAEETARTAGAHYLDLNQLVSEKYDALGEDIVKQMFPADHTHTNMEGAKLNASAVVDGLKSTPGFSLNNYLNKSKN